MARPRLIVGNWKMHKTIGEAVRFVEDLAGLCAAEAGSAPANTVDVVLAPPFTALSAVASALRTQTLSSGKAGCRAMLLGAQDLHWEDRGAFTGAISGPMLVEAGCQFVIVGHSERRRYFAETDAIVQKKVGAALRHGLRPILCIGETWDQRLSEHTARVLSLQLTEGLATVVKERATDLAIAYEPVWAIGSGRAATPAQAQEAHQHIRTELMALWGQEAGDSVPILYGGSVTPDNLGAFLAIPGIDGALVGGACLDPVLFAKMLRVAVSAAENT